jgi:thioredoxin reductase
MTTHDVIVIGAGAAGLNAALLLTRARRSVAIVDSGAPRNASAAHLHGFLSRDGMPPLELLAAGRAEVAAYGGEFINREVTGIEPGFVVSLRNGQSLQARRIVVATGLRDDLPPIPGMAELWGKSVFACPYCHGYEYADRPIGVTGPPEKALLLRQWSSDVVYFASTDVPDRSRLLARDIRIVEGTMARVVASDSGLRGVEMTDGRFIAREALFIQPTFVPQVGFLAPLGYEPSGVAGESNIPGLWVVGNAVNPMATLIVAAAEGAMAAGAVNMDLVQADTAAAGVFSHEMEREVSALRAKSPVG